MYTLRPLKAWGAFSRACEVLQIYFRGQNNDEAYASEGMVSRLYWSCLKSEWYAAHLNANSRGVPFHGLIL